MDEYFGSRLSFIMGLFTVVRGSSIKVGRVEVGTVVSDKTKNREIYTKLTRTCNIFTLG